MGCIMSFAVAILVATIIGLGMAMLLYLTVEDL